MDDLLFTKWCRQHELINRWCHCHLVY